MSWIVLLIGLIAYYLIGKVGQSLILVFLSLYVYWIVAGWNILIIAFVLVTVLVCAKALEKHHSRWLVAASSIVLASGFILLRQRIAGVALPLGYSVLSFTSISLLVDQYRSARHYNVSDMAAYLLFFPKIFAGPIERAHQFIAAERKRFEWGSIYKGVKFLIFASFCKLIIGDKLSAVSMEHSGLNLWLQIITFSIGFFFDFWAYTLMAIGVGHIFGFRLEVSFDRPYYSGSFREFWHRWNITLSTWLRDYIYIPLGGNKTSPLNWCAVVILVFLVSGVWHGSTWPFLIWGGCHAMLLCIERLFIKPGSLQLWAKVIYGIFVFVAASMLWQLFIVDSVGDVGTLINNLFQYQPFKYGMGIQAALCLLSMVVLTAKPVYRLVSVESSGRKDIIAEVTMLSLMLAILLVLNCHLSFNFFYFRF